MLILTHTVLTIELLSSLTLSERFVIFSRIFQCSLANLWSFFLLICFDSFIILRR